MGCWFLGGSLRPFILIVALLLWALVIVVFLGLLTTSLLLLLWRLFLFLATEWGSGLRPLLVFVLVARLLLLLAILKLLSLCWAVASRVVRLFAFVIVVLGFSTPCLVLLHGFDDVACKLKIIILLNTIDATHHRTRQL